MADDTTNQEKQDGQKTLVSFIVGLLIGGMLVWAFSGSDTNTADQVDTANEDNAAEVDSSDTEADNSTDGASSGDADSAAGGDNTPAQPQLSVGDGSIVVNDQPAGSSVTLASATYPVSEGWIGIRTYTDGQTGPFINGVVRFSESQGLVPDEIILQNPTVSGQEYAIVIFAEDGDFTFSSAGDTQIDKVFDTFTAQ